MRRFLLLFFVLTFAFSARSQVLMTLIFGDKLNSDKLEFGLEGGLTWGKIGGLETNNYLRDWDLGFYFDIKLKNQWSVYTGVLVKARYGVNELTDNDLSLLEIPRFGDTVPGTYSMKISSFMVPAMIKYSFKFKMYVMAGVQFDLAYKSWVEFESEIDGWESNLKKFNKEAINKIYAGATGGMGYHFGKQGVGWDISVRYYYGFVNALHGISNTKNSTFYLNASIPIGASVESQKKKAERKARKEAKKAAKNKG